MVNESTPPDLREGVRSGIIAAIDRDAELRGGATARRLVTAGFLGAFGAVGMIRMLSGHPYGHHPPWHLIVITALWSGLLVVAFAIAFLQVRTLSLPLARAARVGLLGLGIAGICSILCPDRHFLDWWSLTPAGSALIRIGGLPLSALCFGGVTTLVFSTASVVIAIGSRQGHRLQPLLPAALLLLLLLPGVALQSFGTSWLVFASWLLGTAAGAYAGIAIGIGVRTRLGFA